jgi:PhzF family phenazine biosynthesis protein
MARVDVFTDRPFRGNPAAAVLDADGLTESQMQAIAGEMRVAGTAFVFASARADADFGLRKFTPTREVAYSGHTTIGAVRAPMDAGRLPGEGVRFDTAQGRLSVAVERRADGPVIWLEPGVPTCVPFAEPLGDILEALGLPQERLGDWARPAVTPDADLLLPVSDLETLHRLAPGFDRLGALGAGRRLRAFCLVSLETVEPASSIHSRFFAPQYGIPEDVVTGSVHSSVAVWLLESGRLDVRGELAAFTAEQGDVLGRPGRLAVEVRARAGRPVGVRVGGRAVVVLSGRLRLP